MPGTEDKSIFSDSDSSEEDEDVTGFKRRKVTSPQKPCSSSRPVNASFSTSSNGGREIPSNLSFAIKSQNGNGGGGRVPDDHPLKGFYTRKYVDRDRPPEVDASAPAGRSLMNSISSMRSFSNGNKSGNIEGPSTSAVAKQVQVLRPLPSPSQQNNNEEPTAAEIGKIMGFQVKKGLADYLNEKPEPRFSLDDFEKKMEELYITLDDIEVPSVKTMPPKEEVKWLKASDSKALPELNYEMLSEARKVGQKPTTAEISSEDNLFLTTEVDKELRVCKKLFLDTMGEKAYQLIRSKSNLYERIGCGPYMCRAAMKMANLNVALNKELTDPRNPDGSPMIGPNDLFYFADICAGPGGFTEYILSTKKWEAKGFGMTLRGELDFNFGTCSAEVETFETFYGEAGDGDIYNPTNVAGFIQRVLEATGNVGVHLLMGDGGFSVDKRECNQEILSGQILLSQLLVALAVVRPGGNFVCKFFDTFTPFTVSLIYLAYFCFDTIAIHKPITSRPANAERYLICKWKKPRDVIDFIVHYLSDCHVLMFENRMHDTNSSEQILELLPKSVIANPLDPFFFYLVERSNMIALKQIEALKQMILFVRDSRLYNGEAQERAKHLAMTLWQVPEKITPTVGLISTDIACSKLLGALPLTMLRRLEICLNRSNIEQSFKSACDWRFVPVAGPNQGRNRGLFMSLGKDLVYRYETCQWIIIAQREPKLELPSKTLVYGEFINEIFGDDVMETFHIIDALVLGGVDVRKLHYTQRQEVSQKFAVAVTKIGTLPVRAKVPIRMENLAALIEKLEYRVVPGAGVGKRLVCPVDISNPYSPMMMPEGLLFLKITRDPWVVAVNHQTRRKYFFNTFNGSSSEHTPEDAIAGFYHTIMGRMLWLWYTDTNITTTKFERNDPRIATLNRSHVHTYQLLQYIAYTMNHVPKVSPPPEVKPALSPCGDVKAPPVKVRNGDTTH